MPSMQDAKPLILIEAPGIALRHLGDERNSREAEYLFQTSPVNCGSWSSDTRLLSKTLQTRPSSLSLSATGSRGPGRFAGDHL